MTRDPGLDVLLELDGSIFAEDNGYWHKIEATRVKPTPQRPHGISYCLTLHDQYNKRLMGFDNAHAPHKSKTSRYKGRIVAYDHQHKDSNDKGTAYEFSSADQLLIDFYAEVNRIIEEA